MQIPLKNKSLLRAQLGISKEKVSCHHCQQGAGPWNPKWLFPSWSGSPVSMATACGPGTGLSSASRLGQWQALVGAVLSSVCGNGSGSASLAARLPGLCFERNVLVGGEVALIQIWPRGLPC